MKVELVTNDGATLVLSWAAFDKERRTCSGRAANGSQAVVPLERVRRQRLLVDQDGRPVRHIDTPARKPRKRRFRDTKRDERTTKCQ